MAGGRMMAGPGRQCRGIEWQNDGGTRQVMQGHRVARVQTNKFGIGRPKSKVQFANYLEKRLQMLHSCRDRALHSSPHLHSLHSWRGGLHMLCMHCTCCTAAGITHCTASHTPAQLLAEQARQHRDHALHQVHTGGTLQGLLVQRTAHQQAQQ